MGNFVYNFVETGEYRYEVSAIFSWRGYFEPVTLDDTLEIIQYYPSRPVNNNKEYESVEFIPIIASLGSETTAAPLGNLSPFQGIATDIQGGIIANPVYNSNSDAWDTQQEQTNIDLRKYVVGYDKESYKYDLFGVCNHSGGCLGGHYTAFVKNANNKWYHFNDTSVSEVNKNNIITNKGYCYFYKKIKN